MDVAPQYETFSYQRRVPEQTLLYRVLAENLETFLDRCQTEEHELPRYVEKELREYLTCGVLGHGFVRVRCEKCGFERAVAYSCKGRGFCPSCTGRRMSDTAARLVDDVFPDDVPVRQWVLSLPINIRYRLAYDGRLLSEVLAVFLRVVQGWYRKQAEASDRASARSGSVSYCQRFGSSINVNPHFHTLFVDGVYTETGKDKPAFQPAPELCDDDVRRIVETDDVRLRRAFGEIFALRIRVGGRKPRRSLAKRAKAGHVMILSTVPGRDDHRVGEGHGGHRRPGRAASKEGALRPGGRGQGGALVLRLPWIFSPRICLLSLSAVALRALARCSILKVQSLAEALA